MSLVGLRTDSFASPLLIGGNREEVLVALERCLSALDGYGDSARAIGAHPMERRTTTIVR